MITLKKSLLYLRRVFLVAMAVATQFSLLRYIPSGVYAADDGGGDGSDGGPDGGSDGGSGGTLNFGQEAKDQDLPGSTNTDPNNPEAGFGAFIASLLTIIMAIACILVLLNLVWGALEWIMAGSDSSKLQKARDRMVQSVIGVIVLSGTVAFFMVLQNFLGICVLSFSGSCVI